MSDKVHPDTPLSKGSPIPVPVPKPLTPPPGSAAPKFVPPKCHRRSSLPVSPPRHRSRRSCCCRCFLFTVVFLFVLIVLAAVAGAIFYGIFRPKHPTFKVTSFLMPNFNITPSDQLYSRLDLNVSTTNPSASGFSYVYAPITVSISTSTGVPLGNGFFPAFVSDAGKTTPLSTTVRRDGTVLDATAAKDLKTRTTLPLTIDMETRVGFKAGTIKSQKVNVRVVCQNVDVPVPPKKGKPAAVTSPSATCKVKARVKIWKWYV